MTPEEIAEKVAKSMVRLAQWSPGGYWYVDIGEDGRDQDLASAQLLGRDAASEEVKDCRKFFTAKILVAIETALHQCPVPGGLEDDLIDHIRQEIPYALKFSRENLATYLGALMGHIDHLHRIMHTPESQAIAEAYESGRLVGRKEAGNEDS